MTFTRFHPARAFRRGPGDTAVAIGLLVLAGCGAPEPSMVTLDTYPFDVHPSHRPEGAIAMDPIVSWDGKGSLRVRADSATVVPVVDLPALEMDDTILLYEAKIRTRDLDGLAYLEMRCGLGERGTFYSRGLRSPMTGSRSWTSQQVRFRLKPGEVPSSLRLSLVMTGPGTAWVDDVRLLRVDAG
jgi:hypothetical protein